MKRSADKLIISVSIFSLFNTIVCTSMYGRAYGQGAAKHSLVTVPGDNATNKRRRISADEIKIATDESGKFYRAAQEKEKAGKLEEAKQLYYKAALARVHIWGDSDPAVAKISLQIGQIDFKLGHLDSARMWFKKSLSALSKHYGSGDYELVPALSQLAKLESNANDHEAAHSYYQHVLSLQERKSGEDNASCVQTRISLIEECIALKDYYEADQLLKQAMAIEKKVRVDTSDQYHKLEQLLAQIQAARTRNSSK